MSKRTGAQVVNTEVKDNFNEPELTAGQTFQFEDE